jgi:hypothetical protein
VCSVGAFPRILSAKLALDAGWTEQCSRLAVLVKVGTLTWRDGRVIEADLIVNELEREGNDHNNESD